MTRHVPITAFKDHASELIAAAERGEDIIDTRHGRPAIRLERVEPDDEAAKHKRARAAVAALQAHRRKMLAEGRTTSVEELIAWKNEGRR